MKIKINPNRGDSGSALIYAMLILAVGAILLVSYFMLTENQYISVGRSQVWNAAMVNAEAGVEEALAMINCDQSRSGAVTNWSSLTAGNGWDTSTNYLGVYSWGCMTGTVYHISRFNKNYGNGIGQGGYDVYINGGFNGTNTGPEIFAVGYAKSVGGQTTITNAVRKIYIQTAAVSQLYGGIVAQQGIDFNGQNVTIDSWDSSTNTHSIWQSNAFYRINFFTTNGTPGIHYGIWSNSLSYVSNNIASSPSRTAETHVFTDSGLLDAGNANIAGYVETGPGGTVSIKNGGYVGDLAWIYTSAGKIPGNAYQSIQDGHSKTDGNKNFHSYTLPIPTNTWQTSGNWDLPVPVIGAGNLTNNARINIGGVWTYNGSSWILAGGSNYVVNGNSLTIAGQQYQYVITNRVENTNWVYYTMDQIDNSIFIDGQRVVLYLPNGTKNSGSYNISLNTNADIVIWTKGDINAAGNAAINNVGNYTHAFSIYDVAGFPVNVKLNGNGQETGYYYMPSSTMSFAGGGGNNIDFIGAVICYSININGKMNFHFDQSLETYLPTDEFVAIYWKEVIGDGSHQ